jgi:hypothetical protein
MLTFRLVERISPVAVCLSRHPGAKPFLFAISHRFSLKQNISSVSYTASFSAQPQILLFIVSPTFRRLCYSRGTQVLGNNAYSLGEVDRMDSEELGRCEIVSHYVLNEKRYTRCEGMPSVDKSNDDLGDSLCDEYEITSNTDNLCALCRSTFSGRLYGHLGLSDGRFKHHRWSQVNLCSSKGCRLCQYLVYVAAFVRPASHQPIIITRGFKTECREWTPGIILGPPPQISARKNGFLTDVGPHNSDNSIKIQIHIDITTKDTPNPKNLDNSNGRLFNLQT